MAILKNIRALLAVLVVLMLALGAAGCGGNNETPPAGDDGKNQTGQVESGGAADLEGLLAKGKAITGMYYENEFTIEGNDEKMLTKNWVKDTKVRSVMDGFGDMGEVITLVDGDKNQAYMYLPDQQMATKLDLGEVGQGSQDPRESFAEGDLKYVGLETLEGEKCVVYDILDADKKAIGKLWVWEKHGVPLRMESMENGQKVTMVYKNYEFKNFEDALFQLPAGVEVMDMPVFNN